MGAELFKAVMLVLKAAWPWLVLALVVGGIRCVAGKYSKLKR